MVPILYPLLRIAFFPSGPREVPYSLVFLAVFTLMALALKVVAYPPPYLGPFFLEILDLGCLALMLWLLLQWTHKLERWVQTFTAIMGVLTLLLLAFDALTWFLPSGWYLGLVLVFTVWELAMLSHVISYTLEIRVRYAVLYVLVFEVCRLSLIMGAAQLL